jgi:bifunctional oligoribonuclease and PAP phosphatase NrnA
MQNLEAFKDLLKTTHKVVITTHFKPDGDAMGSSLALAAYLKKKHKNVTVITPSDYPTFLDWLPGNDEVLVYEKGKTDWKALRLIEEASIIFCLDFSALGRIQDLTEPVRNSKAVKVMIDHHLDPENFAEYVLHDTKASSTCELIYDFIDLMGDKYLIDNAIAQCIYTGLMTDTGSFRHPSTTAKVHYIASEFIANGLNTNIIHRKINDSASVERLKFLGYMLSEKLVVLPEYKLAYFTVTNEELKRFNSQTGDTEGVVNYALSIKGVAVAVIIVDRPEAVKMSFRSVEEIAVNDIAAKYFEGGGHKNAAGGRTIGIGLEASVNKLLDILPEYKERFLSVNL